MIAYIKGKVAEILEDRVILESGFMGYNLFMPMASAALGILSGLTADELRFAVLSEDVKTISKAPGVGKKTAQKLILELKDKMDLQEAFDLKSQHVQEAQGDMADLSDARKEAVEALTALGYSGADALRAVKKVEMTPGMDVETLLKAALKNLF